MTTTTPPAASTVGEALELARLCLDAAVLAARLEQGAADRAYDRCQRHPQQAAELLADYHHVSWAHRGLVLALADRASERQSRRAEPADNAAPLAA
jgi:hypothetical protein